MVLKHSFGALDDKLTTEEDASLLPPYNMPANTAITVAGPQLTIPGNL
jgi:hypothetical protein